MSIKLPIDNLELRMGVNHPEMEVFYIGDKKIERKLRLEPIDWLRSYDARRVTIRVPINVLQWLDDVIGYGNRSTFIRQVLLAALTNEDHKKTIIEASKFGAFVEERRKEAETR